MKVRFRGWNYDHYQLRKKSWRVKFPDEDRFFGVRELNIVNPRERNVVLDVVEHDLLRDMGQLVTDQYLVHLRLSGRYAGVQVAFEQPDDDFLERHDRPKGDLFGEARHNTTPFQDLAWWQKFASEKDDHDYLGLRPLLALVNARPTARPGDRAGLRARLDEVVDVDALLDFTAETALTASLNPGNHNWRLYLDPHDRRFQVLPWYQFGVDWPLCARYLDPDRSRPIDCVYNPLVDLALAVPALRETYHRKLWSLIQGPAHVSRLLARYDEWVDRARRDVYADPNKHSITSLTWEERYFTDDEWERAVEDMRACLIVRSLHAREFLSRCDLDVQVAGERLVLSTTQPIPARVDAVELAWEDGTTAAVGSGLIVAADTRREPLAADAFVDGALVREVVVPVPTRRELALERAGARVARVEARNAITGEPLPAKAPDRPALRVLELPLAVADGDPAPAVPTHRLALFTAHPRPLRVEALRFAWAGGAEATVTLLQDVPDAAGELQARVLASGTGRGEVALRPSLEVAGREDTFPRGSLDPPGRLFVPTARELRVRVEGAPVAPRLVGVTARDGPAEVRVGIEPAPSLGPLSVRHSGPGFDPAPEQPGARPAPRLASVPPDRTVTWRGEVRVDEDLRLDARTTLLVTPGTRVLLAPGASVVVRGRLVARGTEAAPITFAPQAPGRPWGALALRTGRDAENVVERCRFEEGGADTVDEVRYEGALSAHHCAVRVLDSAFSGARGDDAVSLRAAGDSLVRGCAFTGGADAVDVERGGGAVEGCTFEGLAGDAVDMSGSTTLVRGNTVRGAGDKGVSIGERSTPVLLDNLITGCTIGVAVKDGSRATLAGNTIAGNGTGVSVYVRKKLFSGAGARLDSTVVWGNREAGVHVDEASRLEADFSHLQAEVRGGGALVLGARVRRDDPGLEADLRARPDSPCRGAGSGAALSTLVPGAAGALRDIGASGRVR